MYKTCATCRHHSSWYYPPSREDPGDEEWKCTHEEGLFWDEKLWGDASTSFNAPGVVQSLKKKYHVMGEEDAIMLELGNRCPLHEVIPPEELAAELKLTKAQIKEMYDFYGIDVS